MKKTKRSAAKNGKVMNEVANATSKKALVKVEEMPEIITKKTDGWITDDLHLLIAVGCIIDNYRTIGDSPPTCAAISFPTRYRGCCRR